MIQRERKKLVLTLRKQGLSYADIGAKLKLSRQRVHQIAHSIDTVLAKPITIVCGACGNGFKTTDPTRIYCDPCQIRIKAKQGKDRTREVVRLRDKDTCQNCFRKWEPGTRRFDVHHLNGMCGQMTRDYDSIASISNLITLCHKCHMSNHVLKKKFAHVKSNVLQKEAAKILASNGMSHNKIGKILKISATSARRWITS